MPTCGTCQTVWSDTHPCGDGVWSEIYDGRRWGVKYTPNAIGLTRPSGQKEGMMSKASEYVALNKQADAARPDCGKAIGPFAEDFTVTGDGGFYFRGKTISGVQALALGRWLVATFSDEAGEKTP